MSDEIAKRPGSGAIGPISGGNSLLRRGLQMLEARKGTALAKGDDEGWELVDQLGHMYRVRSASFSPDGTRILTSGDGGTVRIWDAVSGACLRVLDLGLGIIYASAFSPDGSSILTGSDDGAARIWNWKTGTCVMKLEAHKGDVIAVSFCTGGDQILTAGDNTAKLWDVSTGKCLTTLAGHEDEIWTACFSPNGALIATGSLDGTARIWDAVSGTLVHLLEGHIGEVLAAAFSPDGTQLVTGGQDKTARIWQVVSGVCNFILDKHEDGVRGVAYSHDGRNIVTSCLNGQARIWCGDEEKLCKHTFVSKCCGRTAAFSPDGTKILTTGFSPKSQMWDIAIGICCYELGCFNGRYCEYISLSPNGSWIAAQSNDETLKIFDSRDGNLVKAIGQKEDLPEHDAPTVGGVLFSHDGTKLLAKTEHGPLSIYNISSGAKNQLLCQYWDCARVGQFSVDDTKVISGSITGQVFVWDTATGENLLAIEAHENDVTAVSFTPDGAMFLTAGLDRKLRLWSSKGGCCLNTFEESAGFVFGTFSPDGKRILTQDGHGRTQLWEVKGDHCRRLLQMGEGVLSGGNLSQRGFSLDGRKFLTNARQTANVSIRDSTSGSVLQSLSGHTDSVSDGCFSYSGELVATGGCDGTARIWSAATGACLSIMKGHGYGATSVAFFPDDSRIVTMDYAGLLRIWDIASGELLMQLRPYYDGWFTIHADGRILYGGTPRILEVRGSETRLPKNLIKVD